MGEHGAALCEQSLAVHHTAWSPPARISQVLPYGAYKIWDTHQDRAVLRFAFRSIALSQVATPQPLSGHRQIRAQDLNSARMSAVRHGKRSAAKSSRIDGQGHAFVVWSHSRRLRDLLAALLSAHSAPLCYADRAMQRLGCSWVGVWITFGYRPSRASVASPRKPVALRDGRCLLMISFPSREAQSLEVHLPVTSVSMRVTANKLRQLVNNGVTVLRSLSTAQTPAVLNDEAGYHMRARL